MRKEQIEQMVYIAKRAEDLDIELTDRLSLLMDMEIASETFDLDLTGLYKAQDQDFVHDVLGIQTNIDRTSKSFRCDFVPRFAA